MRGRKFELTTMTREVGGHTLHRIRALRDVGQGTKEGTLGGWVESELNLDHRGTSWVGPHAMVLGEARVRDNAQVSGHAVVRDAARVVNKATVTNLAIASGHAHVADEGFVGGEAHLFEHAVVRGYASVINGARVHGEASVSGVSVVRADADVAGCTNLQVGTVADGATVEADDQVVVVVGLLDAPVTLYRARGREDGHVVVAGCQCLSLCWDTERLQRLATDNEWDLPRGWKVLRQALLPRVRDWQRADQGSPQVKP